MSRALPSFSVIAAALRTTTERLMREISSPQTQAPDWSDLEWKIARAVSAMHGTTALLATRLRWTGPPPWEHFIREQHSQMRSRDTHIGALLSRLEQRAREAGVPYVALKGAAIREYSLHHPGERPMGDIDLLVNPRDTPTIAAVLQDLEYLPAYQARRHDVFVPRVCHEAHAYAESTRNPLRIEVHTRISENLPIEPVDLTARIWPADLRPGNNRYARFTSLLLHVALHASGNMRANAMRFLQIYECALLSQRLGTSDWVELLGPNPREFAWWLYPSLSLAGRYVPGSVPASVLNELAEACPHRLRSRFSGYDVTDVSWSNLRIPALPGIEWSRTRADALRFALGRAWPSSRARRELSDGLETLPRFGSASWYRASHVSRIIRWIFGRPPRVQTMCAVTASLRSDN